jgi:hypothetical protein
MTFIAGECDLPRLHLVGIFHTQHTAAYSHCAFTGTDTLG